MHRYKSSQLLCSVNQRKNAILQTTAWGKIVWYLSRADPDRTWQVQVL